MAMTLLTTNTITSATSASSFTSSIDSTYKLYIFKFLDVHPGTDGYNLRFQGSVDGGSNFVNMTTSSFYAYRPEDSEGSPNLAYYAAGDVADGTPTFLNYDNGADNDQSMAGELHLFNPSNATYVKHFYATTSVNGASDEEITTFTAGYLNTTSAINAVKFDMSSGNIDAAVIKMYGVG